MRYFILITFLIFICYAANTSAQQIDSLHIGIVEITATRTMLFSTGKNVLIIDSIQKRNASLSTLADLLSNSIPAFIKSYGAGGAATISARGTEARHNAVLWNGLNINSPTLGLTDVSIIPVAVADVITYLPGGSGPVNGNGALGSVVTLENNPPLFKKSATIEINGSGGSFGSGSGAIKLKLSNNLIESTTNVLFSESSNNFKYKNIALLNEPILIQKHAAVKNYGIIQDFNFRMNAKNIITASAWYQVTTRNIPPIMTTPENFSSQRDSNLRLFAGYKSEFNNSIFSIKCGFTNENQSYDDDKQKLHLRYNVTKVQSDGEWRYLVNSKFIINNGITFTRSEATFFEYQQKRERTSTSLFTGFLFTPFYSWNINFNIRKEFVNAAEPPIIPSLGVEGNLLKSIIIIKAAVGLHYNLPAMNELYWVPGGNINLKPEKAKSGELGLVFLRDHKKLPCLSITAYKSIIQNWIKWQPGSGGVYAPDNLREVGTSGIETSANYKHAFNNFSLTALVNYAYSISETKKSYDLYSINTINRQLIYIPKHIATLNLRATLSGYSISIIQSYIGRRYTTSDNKFWLNPYFIADVILEKEIKSGERLYAAYFKISNITNSSYQVLAYRATPGRWFTAGIRLNFSFNKEKS